MDFHDVPLGADSAVVDLSDHIHKTTIADEHDEDDQSPTDPYNESTSTTAVHFTAYAVPNSLDVDKAGLPFGVLLNPCVRLVTPDLNNQPQPLPSLPYPPQTCSKCECYINLYCQVSNSL